MLNSALKLDYEVYSASYFSTPDMPKTKNQRIILRENENQSCGIFEDEFSPGALLEISQDYLDEVDYIIPISGISPSDFKKDDRKKILGNRDVGNVEDKFRFYKKIKEKFLTPMTFRVSDIDEAFEIDGNYPNSQFILKPLQGSGGYDINLLDNDGEIDFNGNEFIMQEYVKGINLSSSVLSTKDDAKCIANSRLLTMNDFGAEDKFIYIGNILPLTEKSIMAEVDDIDNIICKMAKTSESLIENFGLIGSNGVDYILNEKGLHVIEINPRLQGTFECVEKTFGINMLEAHIKACLGEIIDIPKAKCYTYKKIIYSPVRMKYSPLDLDNIYDMPHEGSITEKGEPLLTIIEKSSDFEKLCKKVESTSKIVNEASKISQLDEE